MQPAILVIHVYEWTRHKVGVLGEAVRLDLKAQSQTLRTILKVALATGIATNHLNVLVSTIQIDAIAVDSGNGNRVVNDIDNMLVMNQDVIVNAVHVNYHTVYL